VAGGDAYEDGDRSYHGRAELKAPRRLKACPTVFEASTH
jgi:hypothetical protein